MAARNETASLNPHDVAPCSARRVESTVCIRPRNGAFAVIWEVTWKNTDGDWDGTFITLADGLSEHEAAQRYSEVNPLREAA